MLDEAASLPGGRVGLALFWLGGATTFVSALVAAFELGAPGFADGLAVDALLIPAWGIVSLLLALLLRRSKSAVTTTIAVGWLILPLAILALTHLVFLDLHLEGV